MNPEWLHVGITAAGLIATVLLYFLKLRDGKTSAEIKAAIAEVTTQLVASKNELRDKMDAYMPRAESDRMHAENKDRLDRIQSHLDRQDKKLDEQGVMIHGIQTKVGELEKKRR